MAKEENRYLELIDLVKKNNLTFKHCNCYDGKSGWSGTSYYIYDGEKCLTDLSINGHCFSNSAIDDAIKKNKDYLKIRSIDNLNKFKEWLNNNTEETTEYVSFPMLDD